MPRPTREKYDELEEKYKSILRTSYGFEVPLGWLVIIEQFLERAINFEGWFKVVQIKEKFGGLRFYIDSGEECPEDVYTEITNVIMSVENRSFTTCEICGEPATYRKERGWKKTLCDNHV
jgi:hypothetical protein